MTSTSVETVAGAAMERTGLSDLGSDEYREGLEIRERFTDDRARHGLA